MGNRVIIQKLEHQRTASTDTETTEDTRPFWERKSLQEMTAEEWESLCDGCGNCCLHKLRDADTGKLYQTNVACYLLDSHSGRCRSYATRQRLVPDCIALTADCVPLFDWLPETCGYRLVAEGKPLPWWHPLISGDPESVHRAGVSVRGRIISEDTIGDDPLEDYIIDD